MNKSGSRVAAGLMFILCVLYYILGEVLVISGYYSFSIWTIFPLVGFILAAIGCFIKITQLSAAGFILCIVPWARRLIMNLINFGYGRYEWTYFIYLSIYALTTAGLLFLVIAGFAKKSGLCVSSGIVSIVAFIALLLMLVYDIISRNRIFRGYVLYNIYFVYGYIYKIFFIIGAFLFASVLGQKEKAENNYYYGRPAYAGAGYGGQGYVPSQPTMQQPVRQAAQPPVRQAAPQAAAQPETDQFEKLTQLKKLLDNGILTQEEFDMKKREILSRHL
ncbi:MAG: SHOCT domain-containing protein [Clostridiales bacterium]|nr:SHOCT domain-containing protein [Clostridiales bacterium]